MATTANEALWGFVWWIRHNRYKSVEAMNEDDLLAMATAFGAENTAGSDGTLTAADPGSYGTCGFPKESTAAGSGIAAAQTQAACDQSFYPEQHRAGG